MGKGRMREDNYSREDMERMIGKKRRGFTEEEGRVQ